MSRTLSGLFLVGALNRPRRRKRTNLENPRTIPDQIGKIPEKSQKGQKRTKKEGQVQIGKPPRLKHPRLAALDSSLQWSSLLTVDTLSFLAYSWSLFAYNFSFSTYNWSFFAYSGKVRLIRALRDCKQRSSTVSKKAPTVSKKASPLDGPANRGDSRESIRPNQLAEYSNELRKTVLV